MDNNRYLYYPAGATTARQVSTAPSALQMGGFGMIVGAAGSAAANIRLLNNGEIEKGEAVQNVVRDSVGAGVATAAATALVGMLGLTGVLSVAGLLTTATATKYLYDSAFEPAPEPPAPPPEPKPTAKKKATVKKTAKKSPKSAKSSASKEE